MLKSPVPGSASKSTLLYAGDFSHMNAVMIPAYAVLLVQTPPSLRTDERRPFNRITVRELNDVR